jgi:beta-phosphoglucomutase-like phosphatase (HAD superfamily)
VEGHAQAWEAACKEYGFNVELAAVRRQIGKGADQLVPALLTPDQVERSGKAIDARQGEIFKTRFLKGVRSFPGVRELFERLREDHVKRLLGSSGKRAGKV